jgi:NADPH:quinone reductase-like Zn-dependent oxidoreductase
VRGAESAELRPASAADWAALLAEHRPDGLVHLWALDAPRAAGLEAGALVAAQEAVCGSVMALARALGPGDGSLREVWLATAGAQRAEDGDPPPEVAQAPLWGLARVLRNERPGLRCRTVDLKPGAGARGAAALLAEIRDGAEAPGAVEEELALRGGRRLARRVRRAPLGPARAALGEASPATDAFRLEIASPGALESLGLRRIEPLAPGPGEVEVRVQAAALNFRDVLRALGMIDGYEWEGRTLGFECVGVVAACGEGVEGLRPGDEVIALAIGSFASRVVTRAAWVAPRPRGLSPEEAATIAAPFATAIHALHHLARVRPGERVLIHSASGGVGLAAVQVARRAGAEILATAGTEAKRAYLESLGIVGVMDSRTTAFAGEVMRRTGGEGVDVVLNSLAGDALARGVEILRPGGRFVELGRRDIERNAPIGLLPFRQGLAFLSLQLLSLGERHPEQIAAVLREAVREVDEGRLEPLPHTVLDLAEAEDAFRLMAQGRHIGRVVLTLGRPSYRVLQREERPIARPDGTYLILGGLGGLGLSLAEHLVGRGARHVVLAGRRGAPRPGERAALEALRATGARVVTARCDATRQADLERLLRRVRATMPPLRGVAHAAMVLDDARLESLDRRRLAATLAPKVGGAWSLHALTRDDDLDHFLMLSSSASVIGVPGQGGYAAGNAALDCLADHRRALGLPALALNLGAVADAGHVARRPGLMARLADAGLHPIPASTAWTAVEELLRRGGGRWMLARFDWPAWASGSLSTMTGTAFAPLLADGDAAGAAAPGVTGDGVRARLLDAPPRERQAMLERHLAERVAHILGGRAERLDPARPLVDMGVDSLMAVELTAAVGRDHGVAPALADVLEGTSLRGLASMALEQLAAEAVA